MPADLSWIDGSVEDAAKLIADRAVASRALGGAVAPGETPAWAADLEKAAAAAEKAAGIGDAAAGYWNQARDWVGGQARAAAGGQVGGAVRDAVGSPGVRNAITGGLIGAGGGAVLGLGANLLSSNKRKRPLSNALFGGLLGGLGGAAIGGLSGTIGGEGQRPADSAARDQRIAARDAAMRDAPNWNVDKILTGLNNLGPGGLARGAGYGAAAGAALGTVPEVAGRAIGRIGGRLSPVPAVTAAGVRSYLTPAQQNGLAGLAAANPRPTTADVRTAVGGNLDPIRRVFRVSKNPHLEAFAGVNRDATIARTLLGGAAYRPYLMTAGTARRGGYGAALGALAGTAVAGGRQGVEMASGDDARLTYLQNSANDLRERFPHIGAAGADPRGAALRQQLADVSARLNSARTNPLERAELERFMQLFQGVGTEGDARPLRARFRDVELGVRPAGR